MRNSIFFIVIGLFVVMLSSCRSNRQVVQQSTHDSTSVEFREVEKVVHVAGDTVKATMQVQMKKVEDIKDIKDTDDSQPFIPQTQTIETDRTEVRIELTKTGEIKATAISKDVDEKVIVQEKTIRTSTSSVTVLEQKESWLKRVLNNTKTIFKTIVCTVVILLVAFVAIKFRGVIASFLKEFFIKNLK